MNALNATPFAYYVIVQRTMNFHTPYNLHVPSMPENFGSELPLVRNVRRLCWNFIRRLQAITKQNLIFGW